MAKILLLSMLGLVSALLFGYAGGAVMATEIGRVSLAAAAVLLTLIAASETTRMIAGSHRV